MSRGEPRGIDQSCGSWAMIHTHDDLYRRAPSHFGGTAYGRDHNPQAMTIWLAGGGVNAGHTVGATDELGAEAVECVHHVRDLHVTLLRLLGLDDNKLTYFPSAAFGRNQLSHG